MATTVVYFTLSGLRLDCMACGEYVAFKPSEARLFLYWIESHSQPRVAALFAIGGRSPRWSAGPPSLVGGGS